MRFAPPTQADGRPSAEVFAEGRRKVIASGVERFDWQFQRADGENLLLDVILHAVQMGGGEIVHGIFRDVTAERLAARHVEMARSAAESSLRRSVAPGCADRNCPTVRLFLEEGQRRLDAALQSGQRLSAVCRRRQLPQGQRRPGRERRRSRVARDRRTHCATSSARATCWRDWGVTNSRCC
jgi:hypothetical protein